MASLIESVLFTVTEKLRIKIHKNTRFVHSGGFSFMNETCGEKIRAPLLGLAKYRYYKDELGVVVNV